MDVYATKISSGWQKTTRKFRLIELVVCRCSHSTNEREPLSLQRFTSLPSATCTSYLELLFQHPYILYMIENVDPAATSFHPIQPAAFRIGNSPVNEHYIRLLPVWCYTILHGIYSTVPRVNYCKTNLPTSCRIVGAFSMNYGNLHPLCQMVKGTVAGL